MAQLFNASEYLLDRRLSAGDGPRTALTGAGGELTYAELAARALDDAGLEYSDVNGIACADVREAGGMFVPSTLAEYLGTHINFGERVDLGGATPVGMVWRAAAAIELGLCDVVVCAAPARPVARPPDVVAPAAPPLPPRLGHRPQGRVLAEPADDRHPQPDRQLEEGGLSIGSAGDHPPRLAQQPQP